MSSVSIVSLWATRISGDMGTPELLTAWDEYSIDENTQGWAEACKSAMGAMGDDLDQYRYITLHLDESFLDQAFGHTVNADVRAELAAPPSPEQEQQQ